MPCCGWPRRGTLHRVSAGACSDCVGDCCSVANLRVVTNVSFSLCLMTSVPDGARPRQAVAVLHGLSHFYKQVNSMKRTLLALAALTVSAGALAQSSVTVFGVADVSVAHISTTGKSVSGAYSQLRKGEKPVYYTIRLRPGVDGRDDVRPEIK